MHRGPTHETSRPPLVQNPGRLTGCAPDAGLSAPAPSARPTPPVWASENFWVSFLRHFLFCGAPSAGLPAVGGLMSIPRRRGPSDLPAAAPARQRASPWGPRGPSFRRRTIGSPRGPRHASSSPLRLKDTLSPFLTSRLTHGLSKWTETGRRGWIGNWGHGSRGVCTRCGPL